MSLWSPNCSGSVYYNVLCSVIEGGIIRDHQQVHERRDGSQEVAGKLSSPFVVSFEFV